MRPTVSASVDARLPAAWLVALVAVQLMLLTIGITRDYELKHEDNNALHATFARSHLLLGLGRTRAQNYFYSPARAQGEFYANHPGGPALILAGAYRLVGDDGPTTTRATAIVFHLLSTWLFYGLACRVFSRRRDVLVSMLLFVGVAQSTYFGRMFNHEVLVLPGVLLLVRGYWELLDDRWSVSRAWSALIVGAVWAMGTGWAGFFGAGAVAAHAIGVWVGGRHPRGRLVSLQMVGLATAMFGLQIVQLEAVLGGEPGYLTGLFVSRAGGDLPYGYGTWAWRMLELHWRYFSLTSLIGLGALAWRATRGLRTGSPLDPAVEVGAIFLAAGGGYVVVFNERAAQHDYWQFLLLPACAIGVTLVYRWLAAGLAAGRHRSAWLLLFSVITFEVVSVPIYTLQDRHRRTEAYCQRVVAEMREAWL